MLSLEKGATNSILRSQSKPIKKFDKKLKKLVQEMIETMFKENGVGLAAPQIGLNLQLAVVRLNVETQQEIVLALINPQINHLSEELVEMEEGCLSLPGKWGHVKRHKSLVVTFQNEKGEKQTLALEGFNARVIQHEFDHLKATLYLDKATEVRDA
ncbi:MAG: hypothetical protein UT55_C0036G0003 [Candidatus Peregrinibacteria bacterium GW2011_GWE2_39_6]|nr:MAG: hypothetical protein UT36_C0011G0035 [Candidatus Peregrinibacteria bacterium GW2011_GWF2_39_17]KKR25613.1 MAG: hypothetical protein UT55_C0036G0003 [Candidatus Peregrinibacteria bacterium GW2011_GWE2_39_6]HCW32512.1 peptide deformylase [Candidatus Peregrinibacteria bacterium]